MKALVSDIKEFINNDKVKIDHKKWFYRAQTLFWASIVKGCDSFE